VTKHSSSALLQFEVVRCAAPFHAARMQVPSFPLPAGERQLFGSAVFRLIAAAERVGLGVPACWLDLKHLHQEGGSRIYSSHARLWSPQMGFGFDPAGRPPRKMELDDLMNAEYGTKLQIDDRSSIYLSGELQAKPAYEMMAGRGITTLIAFGDPNPASAGARYLEHTRAVLKGYMAPGQFQHFPFYLPLLSSHAIASADGVKLREWMGNARLYIREAYDSQELVVLCDRSFHLLFQEAGLKPNAFAVEDATEWQLPQEKEMNS